MARVQIEHTAGLLRKQRITRKDPMLVLPRLDGVLVQHPPHRAAADRLAQRLSCSARQVGHGLPTDRQLGLGAGVAAMAVTSARSAGGKSRRLAASGIIPDAEIARRPAPPPA